MVDLYYYGERHCRDMARDYYDDMHDRNSSRRKRRRGPSKTLLGVIILGIAVCVAVIILWLQFSAALEVKPAQVIESQPLPPKRSSRSPLLLLNRANRYIKRNDSMFGLLQARVFNSPPTSYKRAKTCIQSLSSMV